jgi:hypothetical protein
MSNNVSFSIDAIREAIFAIEKELGLLPKGIYKDVRTRLDVIEGRLKIISEQVKEDKNIISVSKDGYTIVPQITNLNFVGDSVYVSKTKDNEATVYLGSNGFDAVCSSTVMVEDLVYITGIDQNGVQQVDKVDISNLSTLPAVGMVVKKSSPTECSVLTLGNIVTSKNLTVNKRYYIGKDSQIIDHIPKCQGAGDSLYIQFIGIALDNSQLMFRPSFELSLRTS